MKKEVIKVLIIFLITIALYYVGLSMRNVPYYLKVFRETDYDVNYTELVHDIREFVEHDVFTTPNVASLYAKEEESYYKYKGNGYKIINNSESNIIEKVDFYIGDEVVYTAPINGILYINNNVTGTPFICTAINILILYVIVLILYSLINKFVKKKQK